MPLARMAMYGKGVEIHLAPILPTRAAAGRPRSRAFALEGRCFVIGCNQFVTKEHYPADIEILGEMEDWPDVLCRGGTSMYSPLGELVADLDMGDIARGKFDFDVIGHYARPDGFELRVNEEVRRAVGGVDDVRDSE